MAVSVLFRIDQNGHIEVLDDGPPPAATAPPTTARRAYPSTTRPTTAASTPPSDTHSTGTAKAGETIGRVTAVDGRSSPPSPFRGREYSSRWEGQALPIARTAGCKPAAERGNPASRIWATEGGRSRR